MLSKMRNRNKGFTLIELMIVVAIIGILAAIAIPNFLNMRKKSMSSEAKSNLGDLRTMEEAYHVEYGVYAAATASLDYSQPDGARYTYSIGAAGTDDCTLQATGKTGYPVTGETWQLVIISNVAGQPALQ
ncbi:type IV pilin protein [Thermodesulfobacteriota bacterium]